MASFLHYLLPSSFFFFFKLFILINFYSIFSLSACATLRSSSLCYPILEYTNVYISSSSCTTDQEYILTSVGVPIWGMLSPTCRENIAYMMCRTIYPQCNVAGGNTSIELCQGSCQKLLSNTTSCTTEDFSNLQLVNNSWFPFSCNNKPINSTNVTTCNNNIVYRGNFPNLPKCMNYTGGGACAGYLDYDIYIPGYPQNETYITKYNTLLSYYDILASVVGPDCTGSISRVYCGSIFAKCTPDLFSTTFNRNFTYQPVFPTPPCGDLCDDYSDTCSDLIAAGTFYSAGISDFCPVARNMSTNLMRLSLTSCNGTQRNLALDYQPTDFPYLQLPMLGGLSQPFQTICNPMEANSVGFNFTCFPPAVKPDDNHTVGYIRSYIPQSPCELPCPAIYVWSSDEWERANNVMYVSIPSFIAASFMLITYAFFPQKRKQQFIFSFIFCVWIVVFSIIFSFVHVKYNKQEMQSLEYISCKNNAEGADMAHGGYCVFQAFILFEFLLCATCWWLVIALEVYLKVVLEKRLTPEKEKRKSYYYHAFAWGYPTLSLILFLACGGKLGGSVTSIFLVCFIYHSSHDSNPWTINPSDVYIDYFFWYGPIGIMGLIGAILMIFALYKIFKTTQISRNLFHQDGALVLHLRPLIFIISFFLVFFWFFVWRVQYSIHETDYLAKIGAWLKCSVATLNGSKNKCGSQPEKALSNWAWYGLHFFLSFQGILIFLTWGTQADNFTLWNEFLRKKLGLSSSSKRTTYHSGVELGNGSKHHPGLQATVNHPKEFSTTSNVSPHSSRVHHCDSIHELPPLQTPPIMEGDEITGGKQQSSEINSTTDHQDTVDDSPRNLKFTFNSLYHNPDSISTIDTSLTGTIRDSVRTGGSKIPLSNSNSLNPSSHNLHEPDSSSPDKKLDKSGNDFSGDEDNNTPHHSPQGSFQETNSPMKPSISNEDDIQYSPIEQNPSN